VKSRSVKKPECFADSAAENSNFPISPGQTILQLFAQATPKCRDQEVPTSLPIIGLHHIARVTSQPEESIAFYRDVLGFQELPRPPFSFRGAWLYSYGMQIHIIENQDLAGGRSNKIDSRANHLAFRVEDIDQVKQVLADHGLEFKEQVNAGGLQQVFFQDPDGHHVEITVAGDPSVGYAAPDGE